MSYEAITANKNGEKLEYVTPRRHDQDQHRHRDDQKRAGVGDGLPGLRPGRGVPAEVRRLGLPPVNPTVLEANKDKFPDPAALFTIEDLGGWEKVNADLFDIEGGAIAEIEEEARVSTAG